jgi:hypothetical protein
MEMLVYGVQDINGCLCTREVVGYFLAKPAAQHRFDSWMRGLGKVGLRWHCSMTSCQAESQSTNMVNRVRKCQTSIART